MCASPLEWATRAGRRRQVCGRCGFIHYENPVVGVAGVILWPDAHPREWIHEVSWREHREGLGILLARRRIPPEGWCIPCGYVEKDEEVREAVVREVEEETGLRVEPREVVAVESNFHRPEHPTVGVWFRCRVVGGRARAGDDVDALGLFPVEHPPPLAFPTDVKVLRALARDWEPERGIGGREV
jgi:ADP-ribose pyrophosphatase YjhB (NUDIX family)